VAIAAAALATVVMTGTPASATSAHWPDRTTDVRLITFNDFHGNLEPIGSAGRVTLPNSTTVNAGGAAYLSTHAKQLQAQVKNSIVLSAGDNVGASPVVSALFHDEPTIEFLNGLGAKASVCRQPRVR
jgi:5'-nucleotidase